MTYGKLNDKWIKASVLGTLWASSEIVLGSFLHNLRIPFSGNILTAIGLVILISASYKWKEKGLFWRAGVICALLKTMSPSAVIFGPMIAIFSEALLLELSVRILGNHIPGLVIGSVLAMSWNLFQKIFNFILFYGFNIIDVYTNIMEYAKRQLDLQFDTVWAPVVLLLIIFALFGIFSAWIGIRTGRRIVHTSAPEISQTAKNQTTFYAQKKNPVFSHSISWLVLNAIFMAGVLLTAGKIRFVYWAPAVVIITVTWAIRYSRALRQLMKPRLWIFFAAITMLAAFVFTRLQSEPLTLKEALITGLEMNLRAVILITGFSVLGTELYHPAIRAYLAGSYFRQLPPALEISLESLPAMIALIPDLKTLVKNPVKIIHTMMVHAEHKILQFQQKNSKKSVVIVVTGPVESGKTSLVRALAESLKLKNRRVGGFYSGRIMENGITTGYRIVDVSTGKENLLLSIYDHTESGKIGRFNIVEEGFIRGRQILQNKNVELVILDEIGKLELQGKGWARSLHELTKEQDVHLCLSIRQEVIEEVLQKWDINPVMVYDVSIKRDEDPVSFLESYIN